MDELDKVMLALENAGILRGWSDFMKKFDEESEEETTENLMTESKRLK